LFEIIAILQLRLDSAALSGTHVLQIRWRQEGAHHADAAMCNIHNNPERDRSPGRLSPEEAEELRSLLRRTQAADLMDQSVRERIGGFIAQAVYDAAPLTRDLAQRFAPGRRG